MDENIATEFSQVKTIHFVDAGGFSPRLLLLFGAKRKMCASQHIWHRIDLLAVVKMRFPVSVVETLWTSFVRARSFSFSSSVDGFR